MTKTPAVLSNRQTNYQLTDSENLVKGVKCF